MLEFLNAVAEGLPGRLIAMLFIGGLFTTFVSGCVVAVTNEEFGENGLFVGVLMMLLSLFLVFLWIVLRAGYWVVTGV